MRIFDKDKLSIGKQWSTNKYSKKRKKKHRHEVEKIKRQENKDKVGNKTQQLFLNMRRRLLRQQL